MIFSKTFLPLNLPADNTKLMQKQIEKKENTSEVMAEKQFLINPLGKCAILSQNEKTSSIVFPHFQHKQNAKEILRKNSLEPKLQLIEN
jgi:hypothetical protein